MKDINIVVSHSPQTYSVFIESGLLHSIFDYIEVKKYTAFYVISDSNISDLYVPMVKKSLQEHTEKTVRTYIFEAGEKNKHLQTVEKMWQDMADNKLDRNVLVIALGGGVVTDMAGFVAATYLRGVDYISIPTTLEGMVDASVGGKTGINLGHLKNYIGAFRQPKAVLIDIDTLKTLPDRAFLQGYAEVLKHGLIVDNEYFDEASRKSPLDMSADELIGVISRSVEIKAEIVQEDEKEIGARKLLNFGHTIGHVLESLSMNTDELLFHGEAVSIGMIAEAKISEKLGMIKESEFKKIEDAISQVGLPVRFKGTNSIDSVFDMLITDKKNRGGKIKWTLLSRIGEADFNIEIGEKFVREGIDYILT